MRKSNRSSLSRTAIVAFVVAVVALIYGMNHRNDATAVFSSSMVAPGALLVAILSAIFAAAIGPQKGEI